MFTLAPLLEILECPVCLDTVKVPFKECERGHLVCRACTKTLQNCPTCKGAFLLDNPVCMKNLIEALPLPRMCLYYKNGCTEIVEPINDHEVFCGHRPTKCMICNKEFKALELKQHVLDVHGDCISDYSKPLVPFYEILNHEFRNITSIILVQNDLFWLSLKPMNEYETVISFSGVFIGKPIYDFYYTLKFKKGNAGHSVTLKASEKPKVLSCEEELCSMKVCSSTVKPFITNGKDYTSITGELKAMPKWNK